MKTEYALKAMKRYPGPVKVDPDTVKIPTSIRIDGSVLAELKTQALRIGVPYQTLVSSILYRYITGDLVEKSVQNIG